MSVTALDIISNALSEIGALQAGEVPSAEDATFSLSKLNRLFDNWNAESLYIPSTQLSEFNITPNHNPHTIGDAASTPDWTITTNRPTRIDEANLILTDVTPNIYRPLQIVDDAWWMRNPVPTLATQIPYYLYYNEGFPLGQVYLWPVPTTAYKVRLLLWTLLAKVALSDPISLAPGYEDAITLSLAEDLLAPFNQQGSGALSVKATQARARIKSINSGAQAMACDGAVQSLDQRPQLSIANFLSGYFN